MSALLLWNSALREKFNFNFGAVSRLHWQNFDFRRKTGHKAVILSRLEISLIFSNFIKFSALIRSATRKATVIYHVISNNHNSFHLWWKKNLVKHQKVWKYYGQDCRWTFNIKDKNNSMDKVHKFKGEIVFYTLFLCARCFV